MSDNDPGFERSFARVGAERAGVGPPDWARQELPPTSRVGPPIEDE